MSCFEKLLKRSKFTPKLWDQVVQYQKEVK